jgi:hypothetical protein
MTVGARVPDPKKEQQAKVTGCRVALVRAQSRCASGSSAAREGRIPFTSWRAPAAHSAKKAEGLRLFEYQGFVYRGRCAACVQLPGLLPLLRRDVDVVYSYICVVMIYSNIE